MARKEANGDEPITIKKYANRRLYNTATSSYVTLDHLAEMVKNGQDFVVYDAKSGEDITRSVLTQIIFEEEAKGQNLLPISFLRQLIGFYGDNLQAMLPRYLEVSMESFARNQEQMRAYMGEAFGDNHLFRQMEEIGRQNVAMFQQAMSMLTPFSGQGEGPAGGTPGNGRVADADTEPPATAAGADASKSEIDRLREQVEQMQRRLDDLSGKQSD